MEKRLTMLGPLALNLWNRAKQARSDLRGWLPTIMQKASKDETWVDYPRYLLWAFIISRVFFYMLGMRFDTASFQHSMHLADAGLLETDFIRTVWYAHVHPPLFNVISGLILKVSPEGYEGIIAAPLFLILGAFVALGTYYLLVAFRIPARLALLLSVLFMISPATLYYENMYSYGYPIVAAVLWSAIGLFRWAEGKGKGWLLLAFSLMAFATGIHAFFQFVWLLVGAVTLFAIAKGKRTEVLLCALIPVLVAFGFNYKNKILYGEFAASTWTPLTLSYLTNVFHITPEERQAMYATGEFSDLILLPRPELPFEQYPAHYAPQPTGIAVLDTPYKSNGDINFNYAGYLNLRDGFRQNAMATLRLYPEKYLGTVGDALFMYLLPVSDFFHMPSRTLTFWWDWGYNFVTMGRIGWSPRPVVHHLIAQKETYQEAFPGGFLAMFREVPWYMVGWFNFILFPALVAFGTRLMWQAWREDGGSKQDAARFYTSLYIFYTVAYVTAVSVFAAIMENHRYRFYITPFLTLYLAYAWCWAYPVYGKRFAKPVGRVLDIILGQKPKTKGA